jgi:hypothetical protein
MYPVGERCADDGIGVVTEHAFDVAAQPLDAPVSIDRADQEWRIELGRRAGGAQLDQRVRSFRLVSVVARGEEDEREIASLGVVEALYVDLELYRGTGRSGQRAGEVVAVDHSVHQEVETLPALLPVAGQVIGPFDRSHERFGGLAPGDHSSCRKCDEQHGHARAFGDLVPRRRSGWVHARGELTHGGLDSGRLGVNSCASGMNIVGDRTWCRPLPGHRPSAVAFFGSVPPGAASDLC